MSYLPCRCRRVFLGEPPFLEAVVNGARERFENVAPRRITEHPVETLLQHFLVTMKRVFGELYPGIEFCEHVRLAQIAVVFLQ